VWTNKVAARQLTTLIPFTEGVNGQGNTIVGLSREVDLGPTCKIAFG
jgi:hypothetical protein